MIARLPASPVQGGERMRKLVPDAEEERRVLTVMKLVVARVRPMLST